MGSRLTVAPRHPATVCVVRLVVTSLIENDGKGVSRWRETGHFSTLGVASPARSPIYSACGRGGLARTDQSAQDWLKIPAHLTNAG